MKTSDIVFQLMKMLPRYTNSFAPYFYPDAISISGRTVTVTKANHGFSDGYISVTDAKVLNAIDTISTGSDGVTFSAASEHDLTLKESIYPGLNEYAYLTSVSDPSIDGSYELHEVADRETFTLASFPDDSLTDVVLHENRPISINGVHWVTVANANTFSFELSYDLPYDFVIDPSVTKINHRLRIKGASTVERAIENYNRCESDELRCYVVLDDVTPNKSMYSNSDSNVEMGGGNDWNAIMLQPFSVYVFVPERNTTDGMVSRDTCEDLRPHIYKCLCGAKFSNGLSTNADSCCAPGSDGAFNANNKASYVHQFEFSQNFKIVNSDTLINDQTVAAKSIQFDYLNVVSQNGKVIVSTTANLDPGS